MSLKSNPLEAYIAVGGTIKRCWFNVPNHVYRADVSPGGSKVKITVHRRANLGRAGLTTYIIDFKQSRPSTVISDLYRIVFELGEKGVSFKVLDDPSIDTTSRTGKLVMGILALIAEFENDIRRERHMDGIAKAKDQGVKFGRKRELTDEKVEEIRALRESGETVPAIIKRTGFSKASIYRALGR